MLDFTGYTLADARELLEKSGIKISGIQVAAPPKAAVKKYEETFRVLRIERVEDGTAVVLVCDSAAAANYKKPL